MPVKNQRSGRAPPQVFAALSEVEQPGATLAQVVGIFQKIISAVAQILGGPTDRFHCLSVAAPKGVADFFPAVGCQKQCGPRADADASKEKGNVP